jgi:hypothetical protein
MSLDFALYRADGGRVPIPTAAQGVTLSTTEKGPRAAGAFFPLSLEESFRLYNQQGLLYAIVTDSSASTIWRGRVEDVAIVDGGVQIGAFGLQRAFSDPLYTALWSKDTTADWLELTNANLSIIQEGRGQTDNNNRLYMAVRRNHKTGTGARIGRVYEFDGLRTAHTITYDYNIIGDYDPDTDTQFEYVLRVRGLNDSWTQITSQTHLVDGTTPVTGSGTLAFGANVTKVAFDWCLNAALAGEYPGDTGDAARAIVTNIKLRTAASVTSSIIADSLAQYVASINAGQIVARDVATTATALLGELYEDERPSAILDYLALREGYAWGVTNEGVFYFQPRGTTSRQWYVDAATIQLERSLDVVYNSVYAIYNREDGRSQRTVVAADALSVAELGLTRHNVVRAFTTSATQAETQRNALLTDIGRYQTRATVVFDALYDAAGQRWPLWSAMGGDTLTIRNLSPILTTDFDNLTTFRIATTEYSVEGDILKVEPDIPVPTLVTLLARQ